VTSKYCVQLFHQGEKVKFPPSITVHVAAMEPQPVRKVRDTNEGLT